MASRRSASFLFLVLIAFCLTFCPVFSGVHDVRQAVTINGISVGTDLAQFKKACGGRYTTDLERHEIIRVFDTNTQAFMFVTVIDGRFCQISGRRGSSLEYLGKPLLRCGDRASVLTPRLGPLRLLTDAEHLRLARYGTYTYRDVSNTIQLVVSTCDISHQPPPTGIYEIVDLDLRDLKWRRKGQ